ncbi:hypothetical protein DPMN_173074 [Dreissena polymorpha]|uniref:Uncharacterized protein n=1 Tax=Dreissena polymorpha TaxID=45954 RepID=A0A9D4E0Y4_DREPO|nr:hypothetical protein DPMN_173074 [Dreissena polymorpha]
MWFIQIRQVPTRIGRSSRAAQVMLEQVVLCQQQRRQLCGFAFTGRPHEGCTCLRRAAVVTGRRGRDKRLRAQQRLRFLS